MSATNRGSERQKDDYYSTPPWAVDIILPYLDIDVENKDNKKIILSPSAGKGEIIKRLVHFGISEFDIEGIEIDEERAKEAQKYAMGTVICGDAIKIMRKWGTRNDLQLIIDNPPYALVDTYAFRCLRLIGYGSSNYNGATVALLTNVSFLFGINRASFWNKYPADVYCLSKRPSFFSKWVVNKKTGKLTKVSNDATNYIWVVWSKNLKGIWKRLD
jgi:hypothetical protein